LKRHRVAAPNLFENEARPTSRHHEVLRNSFEEGNGGQIRSHTDDAKGVALLLELYENRLSDVEVVNERAGCVEWGSPEPSELPCPFRALVTTILFAIRSLLPPPEESLFDAFKHASQLDEDRRHYRARLPQAARRSLLP